MKYRKLLLTGGTTKVYPTNFSPRSDMHTTAKVFKLIKNVILLVGMIEMLSSIKIHIFVKLIQILAKPFCKVEKRKEI